MLLCDSIIRCRYREGWEREVFMEPGDAYPVTILAAADEQPLRPRPPHPLDVSSSNFPQLDLNPNTGEPMGRHTHQVVAEQTLPRAPHVVLPVIPR